MQEWSFTSSNFLDFLFKHLLCDILHRRENAFMVKVQNSTGAHNNSYCIIHLFFVGLNKLFHILQRKNIRNKTNYKPLRDY